MKEDTHEVIATPIPDRGVPRRGLWQVGEVLPTGRESNGIDEGEHIDCAAKVNHESPKIPDDGSPRL
jgi:hypothetical protein